MVQRKTHNQPKNADHTDHASTPTVQWSMSEAAMCGPVIIARVL